MPILFFRDDARRRIVLTVVGTVTVQEWASATARQIEEQAWRYAVLYDATDPRATFPPPGDVAAIIRNVLELHREFGPRGPVVFAIANDEVYLSFRAWVDTVGTALPYRVEVFRELEQAEHWLDHGRGARDDPSR